ncbi:type II toxin-antitoxin system HicB family antitoxin [Chamaesiphon sp. OTE_8_metabat_110]|uniref:type II toxin-antitoxin system HicB family antitoxin n=1 Tax=Chamaesiphon sp. OTE_8_metabat_110 TaxID=2964696 RepID=UPI00286A9D3F|nr:type II toxin-antitoxin system HicB family antitoxin [Chamaesiphon sp. OTE_8_metabat_110]
MIASTYTVLLEQTADGQSSATVLELPGCHVIAATPQAAIDRVQESLSTRLATAEIVSIQIPASLHQNSWLVSGNLEQSSPLVRDWQNLSESSLAEVWLNEEEDKAWQDL